MSATRGFECSRAQRQKVRGAACLVCWQAPVDPAHLISRGVASDRAGDPRRVIPLCRKCHRLFDEGVLDLLPHLRPDDGIEELGHAVTVHPRGLVGVLEDVTNQKWEPTCAT